METSLRRLIKALLVCAFVCAAANAALLAAWRGSILPDLSKAPRAGRLSAAFLLHPPEAPGDWPLVDFGGFRMRLPVAASESSELRACAGGCEVALLTGALRVTGHSREEPFWDSALLLAPDRRDVSWVHSPLHNWEAMLALSRRVREPAVVPGAWRFETADTRGIVTVHSNHDVLRHVVYAYSQAGRGVPPLLFTRVPTDRVAYVLASLRIRPRNGIAE